MSKFKVGDIVKTRDGREVRILCVDAPGAYPIVGMQVMDGFAMPFLYRADGSAGGNRNCDLLPPKRTQGVNEMTYKVGDTIRTSVHGDVDVEVIKVCAGGRHVATHNPQTNALDWVGVEFIEKPKRTREVTVWVNVYPEGETFYATEFLANANANTRALAVAVPCKITVEY